MAPGYRVAERPLPFRCISPASGQQWQPALQPPQQCRGRQNLDARRGKLDGQRQTVQSGADSGNRRSDSFGQHEIRPHRPRPIDEERHRLVRRQRGQIHTFHLVRETQRGHGILMFALQSQRGTAGYQQFDP